MIELTTPVGRVVSGNPMISYPVTDDKNQPKMMRDGITPQVSYYVGLAIPKGTEKHWNETGWGALLWNEGAIAYPNGEFNAPTFAWKVIDGDSAVPNKKGKVPNTREGWPGHWILNCSNGFAIKCFHRGRYDPQQQIQRKEEVKTGDYARIVLSVQGNNPSPSPGIYLNPAMFELYQAGVEIISENAPNPTATFGAVEGQLPAGALVDTSQPAPATVQQAPAPAVPGTVKPAPEFLTPPAPAPVAPVAVMYLVEGNQYTADQLKGFGWNDQQIAEVQKV